MPQTITQRTIAAIKPGPKAQEIRDSKLTGFIYRVNPARADGTARCSYYAQLGRGKRIKLGDAAVVTPKRARSLATAVLGAVEEKRDPREALALATNPDPDSMSLNDFLSDDDHDDQRYGYWVKATKRSGESTLARLNACFGRYGDRALDSLTPALLDRWRTARLQAGISPLTINRDVAALRASLTKAVEWGYVDQNPLASFKALRVDRQRKAQRALTQDEETALLVALDAREDEKRQARDRANQWRAERGRELLQSLEGRYVDALLPAVILSLNTGLRRGELLALRWSDVDFDRAIITVRGAQAKSGQTREIELNTKALPILRRWKLQSGKGALVFPSRDGDPTTSFKKSYYAALDLAGIDRRDTGRGAITWHSLRHSFGTRLAGAGVPPHTVRELMGHRDISTTMRYFHVTADERRTAVERLGTQ